MATPGANAFEGNTCVTALNAPCPSVGPSLTADPNPVPVGANGHGQTTISWSAPDARVIEIHIGSPDGQLFTIEGNRGSIQTGQWVSDGMTFYLQDVTAGKPLTSDYTLASLVVHLQTGSTNGAAPPFNGWPTGRRPAGSAALMLCIGLLLARRLPRRRIAAGVAGAILAASILLLLPATQAQTQPSAQQTARTLDRMLAAHKSPQELAQYVFDTYGCKGCHTVGQEGKLGFTSRGKQAGQNFEGCIRMLTDMSTIVHVPENQRSVQQRQKAARFEDFGCTFCHQSEGGQMGLTGVGAKLTKAHLGCVDVEKVVAGAPPQPR
jgi:hypothetical protein